MKRPRLAGSIVIGARARINARPRVSAALNRKMQLPSASLLADFVLTAAHHSLTTSLSNDTGPVVECFKAERIFPQNAAEVYRINRD